VRGATSSLWPPALANIPIDNTMPKITTTRERIDQMLAQYTTLEHDAFELIDAIVKEMCHEHPGMPVGIVKQCEIHNRAGSMLNVPKALRLLRERFPA
jgi:hypothetical protein